MIKEYKGMRFELIKNIRSRIEQNMRNCISTLSAGGKTFFNSDNPKPTEEDIQRLLDIEMKTEIWISKKHQVAVHQDDPSDEMIWPAMIHLSIKRIDKKPIRDWREIQSIKNTLIGPKHEGVELYPAEDRLVDGANQYHLWVLAEDDVRFPFGFHEGRRVNFVSEGGVVQREGEIK